MKTLITKFLLLGGVCLVVNGCANPAPTEPAVLVPPSAGELLARVGECLESVDATHQMLQVNRQPFRRDVLRQRANEGIVLTEKVVSDADASPEEVREAMLAKSQLLYLLGGEFREDYLVALRTLASEIKEGSADADLLRLTGFRWLAVELSAKNLDVAATEPAVWEFARSHPKSDEAISIVALLAGYQLKNGNSEDANRIQEKASDILSDPDRLALAIRRLRDSQRGGGSGYGDDASFNASVLAALGGQEDGYFVIHSYKKAGKKLRNNSVCKGLRGVAKYAREAGERGRVWRVVVRYPETTEGYEAAMHKAESLYYGKARDDV